MTIATVHRFQCALCHSIVERPSMPIRCGSCGSQGQFRNAPPDTRAANAQEQSPFTPPQAYPALVPRIHPGRLHAVGAPHGPARGAAPVRAIPLSTASTADVPRRLIFPPIDYVLGGGEHDIHASPPVDLLLPGFADGHVIRIAGSYGAGKSTLLAQALGNVCKNGPTLYASGEETYAAVGARARRVGVNLDEEPYKSNFLMIESKIIEDVLEEVLRIRPLVWLFDSIQVARSRVIDAEARSARMVTYVCERVFDLVHGLKSGVAILVNQVVKDDSAAGPQTAAHAVDAQLFLDKSETPGIRVLSTDKNRHGPETRTATLVMTARGLVFSDERFST